MTSDAEEDNVPDIDRRADLARSFSLAATIVNGVGADQLREPTPCPDYDVAALIDHLVGAGWRTVTVGRGENPEAEEFPTSTWPTPLFNSAAPGSKLRRHGRTTPAWPPP